MATQTKKRTAASKAPRNLKRKRGSRKGASQANGRLKNVFLPLFLSLCLLICLAAIFALGYQRVTASTFFDVKSVDVRGTERVSKDDISRIVVGMTEKSGSWNADLLEIKGRIEKLAFVKSAAVSRVLPSGIRVSVAERVPVAVVQLSNGNFLVDSDGNVLAPAAAKEARLPVMLVGWDDAKSEKAMKENIERIKLFQKMMAEWGDFDLVSRVTSVNLTDLHDPKAVTMDSGLAVSIALGKEAFGEHLRKGISAIVGKGATFDGVELSGQNMILISREPQQAVQTAATK